MEADFVLPPASVQRLNHGRWVFPANDAVFQLTGPGTIDCIQGVFTNDIVNAGPQALVWGAFLTPKGQIITDLWVKRDGQSVWLMVPRSAREIVAKLLARSFPPRLTRVVDQSDVARIWWLVTPSIADLDRIPGAILPHEFSPFTALVITATSSEAATLESLLQHSDWDIVGGDWAAARKVLLAWPTLGREIDERTLVQEVRFDELKGVKYDKGCFTGQETVARLHFRGHANRALRKLVLGTPPTAADIFEDGKSIGRITTWGFLGEEIVALGKMRSSG